MMSAVIKVTSPLIGQRGWSPDQNFVIPYKKRVSPDHEFCLLNGRARNFEEVSRSENFDKIPSLNIARFHKLHSKEEHCPF